MIEDKIIELLEKNNRTLNGIYASGLGILIGIWLLLINVMLFFAD